MKQFFKQTLMFFCAFSAVESQIHAVTSQERRKTDMIHDLESIKHNLDVGYAPAEWKKTHTGWDLEEAFENAKGEVVRAPHLTVKQFQGIVKRFLDSTNDYHVSVLFQSTEAAVLPFTVKEAAGKYFIDWIDRKQIPSVAYRIRVGDELIQFGGKPVKEVIQSLKSTTLTSSLPTEERQASLALTFRAARIGDEVPHGPIVITTRSTETGQLNSYQLIWDHRPEKISDPFSAKNIMGMGVEKLTSLWSFFSPEPAPLKKNLKTKLMMANPLHQIYAKHLEGHDGGLGAPKSFIPPLGSVLWTYERDEAKDEEENPEQEENSDENYVDDLDDLDDSWISWNAYIYEHPTGAKIGYVRIPHYIGTKGDLKQFNKIICHCEENTDLLVIDQVDNYGGLVSFLYRLASMLTSTPLKTPHHHIKITQEEVLEAHQMLSLINIFRPEDMFDGEEEKWEEDSVDYQFVIFLKTYYQFIIDEWNAGRLYTNGTAIEGVDYINPHPQARYTKPILMLINELDFSGGDFMPAILQDNQRATLFGARTAGAGGFIRRSSFPNRAGIDFIVFTGSLAERANASLQKIENLGVTPDIEYQVTPEDIQNGYKGYVEAVNQAVKGLLKEQIAPATR